MIITIISIIGDDKVPKTAVFGQFWCFFGPSGGLIFTDRAKIGTIPPIFGPYTGFGGLKFDLKKIVSKCPKGRSLIYGCPLFMSLPVLSWHLI